MMATGNGDSAAAGDPKSQEGLTVSTDEIKIVPYSSELQMPAIMRLIKEDLSEPYSIYTYRYFIYNWPFLCWMAFEEEECIGVIVSKIEIRHGSVKRGYIAMLAVDKSHRRKGIGTMLVKQTINRMIADGCDEVVLETEVANKIALCLYEKLGFVRDKYLYQYYLNGENAYRLKLWLNKGLHRLEMFVKFRLMGAKGKVEYVPLSDEKAAEVGAEMLGEAFLYSVAASYMLYEYYKSIKKGIEKETNTSDNISDLQEQIATLANRVEQLALTVDNKLEQLPSDKSKK